MGKHQVGEITTLFVISAFIFTTFATLIGTNVLQSKKNIIQTKAQVATPRDDTIQDQSACSTDGEWRIKCTGDRGPCGIDAGVGVPYRCSYGTWNITNSLGECNLSCRTEEPVTQAPRNETQAPQTTRTEPVAAAAPIATSENYCANNGEWKMECIQDQGPCESNAGVGIPSLCENNLWSTKQSECTTKCVVQAKAPPPPPPPPTAPRPVDTCVIRTGADTALIKKGQSYCDVNSFLYTCDGDNRLLPINCGQQSMVCVQDQGAYNARCSQPPTVDASLVDADICATNPGACAGSSNTGDAVFVARGSVINRGRGNLSDLFVQLKVLSTYGEVRFVGKPENTSIRSDGTFETKLTMSANEAIVFANQCNVYVYSRSTGEIIGAETQLTQCTAGSPMAFNAHIEYPFYVPPEPTATPTPFPNSNFDDYDPSTRAYPTPTPYTWTPSRADNYQSEPTPSPTITSVPTPTAITYAYGGTELPTPTPVTYAPEPTLLPTPTDIPVPTMRPPAYNSNAAVVEWASKISQLLEPGPACNGGFCRMIQKVTNGNYATNYREGRDDGVGKTGRYWCTTFARDSYFLAGKTGPTTESVAQMVAHWEDRMSSVYYPYYRSNDPASILAKITPGCMMFDETTHRTHTGDEHVAVVQEVAIYDEIGGTGEVVTLDGNRPNKVHRYPFYNWQIQNNKYNFVSFGCF